MPKKGNGMDLANDYLRQIVGKLGAMEVGLDAVRVGLDGVRGELVGIHQELDGVHREQQAMRKEQEAMRHEQVAMRKEMEGMHREMEGVHGEQAAMRVQMGNIEDGVRQIASFVGQERVRQLQEFEDLKRRVEVLEHKAA